MLPTLNADGTRRWLHPRLSRGRFLKWRRVVAYALLVVYNVLPWIRIDGRPSILLDLPRREFTFFGTTFLPTDTLLLMLFLSGIFVTIFLVTALFGRLWCGWACPQTVYMEFVYRPIERLFDGSPESRRRGRKPGGLRTALKYAVFFVVSLHLAHTFLAYFVGADRLFDWTMQSPFEHPTAFLIVAAMTALMMFDFCFFREQTCIVACPYGRLQSVLLDRRSLIIGYDEDRGEPRGKLRRAKPADGTDIALPQAGDCIDCKMCVTTCPTGIDIRDGLQMECVGCAQCIDACDAVMDRIGRPRGLIRYSSQEAIVEGGQRTRGSLVRPRVVLYPALLLIIVAAFTATLLGRQPADVTVLRSGAEPYVTLPDGTVANDVRLKVVNRTDGPRRYTFEAAELEGASLTGDTTLDVESGATEVARLSIVAPSDVFELGKATVELRIADDDGFARTLRYRLQGPWTTSPGTDPGREEPQP